MSEPETGEPTAVEPSAGQPKMLTFKGREYRAVESVSDYAVLEFWDAADDDDGDPIARTLALKRLAEALVDPVDRDRFKAHCRRVGASFDDLMEFLGLKVEDAAERPTGRPSDSTDGPVGIEPKSVANSDVKVSPPSGLELVRNRPDLAVFLDQAAKVS